MRTLLIATIISFIGICAIQFILNACGLHIHNQFLYMGLCAFAGSSSVLLAGRI